MYAENSLRVDRLYAILHFLFLEEQFAICRVGSDSIVCISGGSFAKLDSAIDAAEIRRREVRVQCPLLS
jgi:hypothetical protein